MMTATTGQVTVCISEKPIEEVLRLVDSGAASPQTERFEILRASTMAELEGALKHVRSSHLFITGLLDTLYDPGMLTREAARALGRLKVQLDRLAESGTEIIVLCEGRRSDLGTRAHFLASLCASADRVVEG